MTDNTGNVDQHFMMLVLSLQAGAMQQMGKVSSPISGEVERNLEAARAQIDTLSMLEKKMAGNLTDDESKFLSGVLYQLRLNYVDETKKGDQPEKAEAGNKEPEGSEAEQTQPEPESGEQAGDRATDEGHSDASEGTKDGG